ncbi:MAG: lipoate--protein ligase [Mycoplasmatales bacterium]|nr:lipoate--protein ligase [Mycoplasmatales bacterium]
MKIGIATSGNHYINQSIEEVLVKDEALTDDYLILYVNKPTIVFGRNQNAHAEINFDYVNQNNILLSRRVSGGGAVYHDNGNVNFVFVTDKKPGSYETFLAPIIEFLNSLGLNANFKGKNDLVIDGYKVSGNAQYVNKNRMYHHGTLLFDTDLTVLSNSLKVNKLKMKSKGITSARQRVSNIKNLLKYQMSTKEFVNALYDFFVKNKNAEKFDVDNYQIDKVKAISNVRKSKNWLFAKNPEFEINNERRFDGGTIQVNMNVKENKITDMIFFGDYLSSNDFVDIYNNFIGQEFTDENIRKIINNIDNFSDYFGKLSKENLVDLVLGK